eukprot:gene18989-24177_t
MPDSPLFNAVWYNQVGEIGRLLKTEAGRKMVDQPNDRIFTKNGTTPLVVAIDRGRNIAAKLLLEDGKADANLRAGNTEQTPLMVVARSAENEDHGMRMVETAALLLKHNADPHVKSHGRLPLEAAAYRGRIPLFNFLLEITDANVNEKRHGGQTLLHRAKLGAAFPMVSLLLELNADPTIEDDEGDIPLDIWGGDILLVNATTSSKKCKEILNAAMPADFPNRQERQAKRQERQERQEREQLFMEVEVEREQLHMSFDEDEIALLEAELEALNEAEEEASPLGVLAGVVFKQVDPSGTAEWLHGSALQPLMLKCNPPVPQATLGQIWTACATTHRGKLNKPQVVKMLGFLGQVQNGLKPDPTAYMEAPLPTIVGLIPGLSMPQHKLDGEQYAFVSPAGTQAGAAKQHVGAATALPSKFTICGYRSVNGTCTGPICDIDASVTTSSGGAGGGDEDGHDYELTGDSADPLHGAGNRLLDLQDEDGESRSPIAGLFPDNKPIPESLEASLALVAHLMPSYASLFRAACKKARKVAKTLPDIPQHMIAAIVFYTLEDIADRETSPYYLLNKALRAKSRRDVKLWKEYIWLLLNALKMIPAADNRMVYRGMKVGASTLGDDYENGEDFVWSGFSSTATTVNVMSEFMGMVGPRTLFNLELTELVGRDLRAFSMFESENEILLPPNMQFKVVSRLDAGNGLTIVQCKQVDADDEILSLSA